MKVRIISALVALAILIPVILLGGYVYAIVIGILSILAYKEILDLKKSHAQYPDLIKILGLISLLYLVLGNFGNYSLEYAISYRQLLLPLLFLLLPTVFYSKNKYTTKDAFYLLGVTYLIGLLFNTFIQIRNVNLYLFIYLICITIFTDTFAYLIGSLIGKHKMCPKISPLKSWEGFFAGIIGGVITSVIVYTNLVGPFSVKLLFITIILAIIGELGDLIFSKIKRENEIKDFSNIMPGHGGILDRLDSIALVLFAYVVLYSLM